MVACLGRIAQLQLDVSWRLLVAMLPSLFIGSSTEGKDVAEYLQDALQRYCKSEVWDQNVFEPSGETLGTLLDAPSRFDFAALILTPDDLLERRGRSGAAPRDNVVFELGLFLAALGRDRVFMVSREDQKLMLPSDLLGVASIRYPQWDEPNLRSQINPVALRIREAIIRVGSRTAENAPPQRDVLRFAADLAAGIANGSAGSQLRQIDQDRQERWRGNLLAMLAEIFLPRAPDSYVAWLRPSPPSSDMLSVSLSRTLPAGYDHYSFGRGEGLAGNVWSRGTGAAHAPERPHEWWLHREGCDNLTYLCAPVGGPSGAGGVLSVGSDSGFQLAEQDLDVVQLFAQLLATSLESDSDNVAERRLLRERVETLDESLARSPVSKAAHPREIEMHNRMVSVAKELMPDDRILDALAGIPTTTDPAPEIGLLRMSLSQIRAAL